MTPYRTSNAKPPTRFSTSFAKRTLICQLAVIIVLVGYDVWLRRAYARLPVRTVTVDREVRVLGPIRLLEHCSEPPPCVESARSYSMGGMGYSSTPVVECPNGGTVHSIIAGSVSTIECRCR